MVDVISNFEYDVSIIMPIFNAEEFIEESINSVINQTGSHKIQVLLIDDGSDDSSVEIVSRLMNDTSRENIDLILIQNNHKGVSRARNTGIRFSKGKYILYLDSDDLLSESTIDKLINFFDKHYNEIDIVTYPIFQMYSLKDDKEYAEKNLMSFNVNDETVIREVLPHSRNNFFMKDKKLVSQIVDVEKNPYTPQTTMNVMVKNSFNVADRTYFYEQLPYAEDANYNTEYVMKKHKLGFCSEGTYYYRKSHFSSVNKHQSPVDSWEILLQYYDYQFLKHETKEGKIPRYVQNVVLYEIRWRFASMNLFPHHLGKEYLSWENQFRTYLKRIDVEVIFKTPLMDRYHRYALLLLRKNQFDFLNDKDGIDFYTENKKIGSERNFETIVTDMYIKKGVFYLSAFIKVPLQEYIHIKPIIRINGEKKYLTTFVSSYSYHRKREKSNEFKGYTFSFDLNGLYRNIEFNFSYEFNGIEYEIKKVWMSRNRIFSGGDKKYFGDKFTFTEIGLMKYLFEPIPTLPLLSLKNEKTKNISLKSSNPDVVTAIRNFSDTVDEKTLIWLYSDREGVIDNAYYQFMNDFSKDDGVERYYIVDGDPHPLVQENIPEVNRIHYGSVEHFQILTVTQLILGAYQGFDEIFPYGKELYELIKDKISFDFVYLQHGVLHATTPWIYSKERTYIDKFVVSSEYEKENLIKNYGYTEKDILLTGMARFDIKNKETKVIEKPSEKRILFAPSWRNTLIDHREGTEWIVNTDALLNSKYYEGIKELFNSNDLYRLLEENDLFFDIKLHPIFATEAKKMGLESDRIHFIDENFPLETYKIFITDFSSFVFDAVYGNIPIIYYVPDYYYFRDGNHTYSNLDISLDDAFGDFVMNVDDLTKSLRSIINNDYETLDIYCDKVENFYNLPVGYSTREGLYEKLILGYGEKNAN
ncbi:hypothetical protein IGK28_002080 [Enterococcus sp. DIV0182]|uniref:bifunctional glycosyltransferase/CDP-glycerol:glycerophosphate glycerophosphotransferase n=1 Tax=Enterococcus TaxID=1350 RepID=UPI000A342625|nr:glycosyltransferase [Enterococcus sp. 5B7_DIV0075]OTP23500.1 hypothetical protein A5800_001348 [Enterococcus sp. 5B7_DIV0075]